MKTLRIAIQSKGRLNEDSLKILNEAGIYIEQSKRKLLSRANNFPLEILYLRDDDIPAAVESNIADIGIVGENEVYEKIKNINIEQKLGFSKCRLSLAIPKNADYKDIQWFNGKRVATSYPNILDKYFKENNINARIEKISGSVEIAPAVDLSDAIFDIVSSGGTLTSNGLKEVEVVINSEAVLISSSNLSKEKREILSQLMFRVNSIQRCNGRKYMLLNIENTKIDDALKIIPCMKSPSILPLANTNWSSMHAVVGENEIWDKIEQLKAIGAEDILVLSLEKMIL